MEEEETAHEQLSLLLREPLALRGSEPSQLPGLNFSPRLYVHNLTEAPTDVRTGQNLLLAMK